MLPEQARALLKVMRGLPWRLVLNDQGKHFDIHPVQREAMTGKQRRQLRVAAAERARHGFTYFFENVPVHDMLHGGRELPAELEQAAGALNSGRMLRTLEAITGLSADFCDIQATRFGPGMLLTDHDDNVPGKNRLFAYTLSLAEGWKPSWGGGLTFLDEDGREAETVPARYNTLNLFRVPVKHRVQPVRETARSERISLTGWYRAGEPEEFAGSGNLSAG